MEAQKCFSGWATVGQGQHVGRLELHQCMDRSGLVLPMQPLDPSPTHVNTRLWACATQRDREREGGQDIKTDMESDKRLAYDAAQTWRMQTYIFHHFRSPRDAACSGVCHVVVWLTYRPGDIYVPC